MFDEETSETHGMMDENVGDDFEFDVGAFADGSLDAEDAPLSDGFEASSGEFRKFETRPAVAPRLFGSPSFKK